MCVCVCSVDLQTDLLLASRSTLRLGLSYSTCVHRSMDARRMTANCETKSDSPADSSGCLRWSRLELRHWRLWASLSGLASRPTLSSRRRVAQPTERRRHSRSQLTASSTASSTAAHSRRVWLASDSNWLA